MTVNPYPGFFVDIEGLDGSGATTQTKLIGKKLRTEGFYAFVTKEPTDNVLGGLIRGALTGVYRLPSQALQLLFVADRSHHLDREIIPILNNGNILITDRFLWSTIAFGGVDLSRQWLLRLHHYCFLPDISFFLRVSPQICIKRLRAERFDFELFEKEDKMWKVWENYEWLSQKFPKKIIIVDGEKKPKEVLEEILTHIHRHSKFKKIRES